MFGFGNRNRQQVRNDTFGPSRVRNALLAGAGMLAWRWWRNRQSTGSQSSGNQLGGNQSMRGPAMSGQSTGQSMSGGSLQDRALSDRTNQPADSIYS
jgi:hypothetical protein